VNRQLRAAINDAVSVHTSVRRLAKAGGELLKSPAGDGQEEADAKSP